MRQRQRWFQPVKRLGRHCWLPLLLGIVTTIAIWGLWQQLLIWETHHIELVTQHEATAVNTAITRDLTSRVQALQRMVDRWQSSDGIPKTLWETEAFLYIRDFYGFQAVEWVDPSLRVSWVMPLANKPFAQSLNQEQEVYRQRVMKIARDLRQPILTKTLPMAQGARGFSANIPIFIGERFDGFIVGVFRVPSVFESILQIPEAFQIRIYDDAELIYSSDDTVQHFSPQTAMVNIYGVNWKVEVFPTSALITQERSLLPDVVLGGGLLTAWMLAFSLYAGQRSARYAQRARKINQQLQDEIDQRQQVEASLRESEERWQLALRGNNDGIWDWNVKTNEIVYSSRCKEMLGYADHEHGNTAEDRMNLLHPDDREWVIQAVQKHLSGVTPFYITEHRVRCKDGSYQWILDRGQAIWDDAGNVIRMTGSHTDITEHKQADAERRELLIALENAVSGISRINAQGRHVFANRSYANTAGYQPEEMIGMPWQQMVHPDDVEHLMSAYQHMRQHGKVEIEARGIRKDGAVFHKQLVMISICDEQQQFIGHHCFMKDISEKARLEAERQAFEAVLQQSESTLRSFFNSGAMLMGVVELHENDILHLSDNQTAASFFGTTPEAMQNRFASEMGTSQSHLQRWIDHYREAARTQAPIRFEYPYKTSTGYQWLAASICQIAVSAGQRPRFSYIVEDITKRKQIETERQQTEMALRQSEARFQAFMDHSPALKWTTNQDGQIFYVNETYCRTFQKTADEVIGKRISDLFSAEIAQEYLKHIQQITQTDQILETVESAPRPDGTTGDFLVYRFVIPDPSGQTLVGGIAIDVTRQHEAETALQQSEERLQLALEASGDGLWDWNIETGSIYHSPRHQEILGYIGETTTHFNDWQQTIHPDDQPYVFEHLQAHLQDSAAKYNCDYRVCCKSGKWKWITDYGKVVAYNSQGKPSRMIGAYKDISDRKQAEEDLRHQKEMLQTIVNHIPVMIALFNEQGRFEFINPEFERTLGWALEEWQQRDVLAECYPKPKDYQQALEHMLAANGRWRDFTSLTASGYQLETSWTNILLSNGNALGIGQDISDRKQKELELRQAMEAAESANRAKSIFLANMSHELRTPLNVILGFAQVMAHDKTLTPSQQEDLQTIRRSGDHLLSLINDVLDLSKIESGHCDVEPTGFDLIALLHSLRTMLSERATVKGIWLHFEIAPEVPQFIFADAQKLRQILLNLLGNAIKFTHQGGVTLRVKQKQWRNDTAQHPSSRLLITLQFEVSDTGVGMTPAEVDLIFDAFVQAQAGRNSVSGTGLGLTISRKLLELMNGTISVSSVLEQGSTFTFILPVYPCSGVDVVPEQHERFVIGLVPGQPIRRILVADDQPENRLLIVRLLAQLGLEVCEATNGQEAVHLWQVWQPDLTWMDIRMPGLDGYEATKQIRALEHGAASIIIALTAQASQSDRTLALAAGCNDYISKPFREETLFLKMAEYLGLEYLYAEPNPPSDRQALPTFPDEPPGHFNAMLSTLPDLTLLSKPWLMELEQTALCGDDQTIEELTAHLPPAFTPFVTHLNDLARQYQFEAILKIVHTLLHPQP